MCHFWRRVSEWYDCFLKWDLNISNIQRLCKDLCNSFTLFLHWFISHCLGFKVNIVIEPSQNSYTSMREFSSILDFCFNACANTVVIFISYWNIYLFISNSCWKVLTPNNSLQLEFKPWPWTSLPKYSFEEILWF